MIYSNFTGRVAKKAKVIDGVNGQFLRYYSNELGIVPGSLLLTSIQRNAGTSSSQILVYFSSFLGS